MVKILNKPSIDEFKKIWETNTAFEVAKFFDVSKSTVDRWVRSFELFKYKREYPKLTILQKDLITGSLLGDGSISKVGTFAECHSIAQKDYLVWKKDILQPFSYELCYGKTNSEFPNGKKRKKESEMCSLYTARHDIFRKIEKDWYLRGTNGKHILKDNRRIKHIPNKLKLTPFIFTVWFMDDGYNNFSQRNAAISTDGFSPEECDHLSSLIKSNLGFDAYKRPTKNKEQYEIYIPARSYFNCMDLIKEQNIHCMNYKFDISKCVVKQKRLTQKQVDSIFDMRELGMTQKSIAKKLGVTKEHIWFTLNRRKHRRTQ